MKHCYYDITLYQVCKVCIRWSFSCSNFCPWKLNEIFNKIPALACWMTKVGAKTCIWSHGLHIVIQSHSVSSQSYQWRVQAQRIQSELISHTHSPSKERRSYMEGLLMATSFQSAYYQFQNQQFQWSFVYQQIIHLGSLRIGTWGHCKRNYWTIFS